MTPPSEPIIALPLFKAKLFLRCSIGSECRVALEGTRTIDSVVQWVLSALLFQSVQQLARRNEWFGGREETFRLLVMIKKS